MKALKDCKTVFIKKCGDGWYWQMEGYYGFFDSMNDKCHPESRIYTRKRNAINNWEKFAKLNDITNCIILY